MKVPRQCASAKCRRSDVKKIEREVEQGKRLSKFLLYSTGILNFDIYLAHVKWVTCHNGELHKLY